MAVRVRMFAALREASGHDRVEVPPATLTDLLDDLRRQYGEPFTARLRASTVLVDGSAVAHDAAIDVPDGADVSLLPPVSGGA